MNKLFCFLLIVTVSCQKDFDFDPESGMETGNAILFKKCEVVDTFPTHLTARAEFIVFEGLESTYGNGNYTFKGNILFDSETEILTSSTSQDINKTPYNNVILINTDNKIWLEPYSPGYYLERYFRKLDSIPSSVSIVSYGKESNNQPVFHIENSNFFSNSASFNSASFYDVTRTENHHNSNVQEDNTISFQETINVLSQVIDSLSYYAEGESQSTITLFLDGSFDDTTNADLLMSEFVDKATANNVQVHVFSNYSLKYDLQIAQLTGGFFYTGFGCLTSLDEYVPCYEQRVSGVGVILQNLHDILQNNYKKHEVDFKLSKADTTGFSNIEFLFGGITFKDFIYPFTLRK